MNAYLYQYIIATPILILHIVLIIIAVLVIFNKHTFLKNHFKKFSLIYGLIIAITAFVGSLGFSEGFNYEPCKFCWIQRIFHYPQLVLFLVALKSKDKSVWKYSIYLSLIGFIISLYQILIQFSPTLSQSTICSIIPTATNCSDILIQAYGYITIPVMSATLFLSLIIIFMFQKK